MAAPNSNGTHTTPFPTNPNHAKAKTNGDTKIEISMELIMMVRNNAFTGAETNDAVDHITRFLQIIDLVKTPNVNIEQLCVEIVDKFFHKCYPLSRASKSNDAKGCDNITLFDDGESSDDDCDKSNLIIHHDTSPFPDPYQATKNKGIQRHHVKCNDNNSGT
ncbi:hypothetical protein Tco_1538147 [Tanacetum coccineum]